MKKIFILGAGRLQIPAIKKAKEKGMYVYALDYDPQACGIKYADEFLCISTIDREAVYEAALKYNPDYIITSTSDMPVRTVSWVNEKLEKKTDISYEGSVLATNKAAMRKRMKECGVPIPKFCVADSLENMVAGLQNIGGKCVVKPADNSASRGVILVDTSQEIIPDEIYEYCHRYSRNGEILIEEYMEGPEVSVEAYSINGNTHIITVTDKIVTELPFFVELGHTEPSSLGKEVLDEIEKVTLSAVKAIGMMNGPTHTELKVTDEGVKLVEIAARLGGDFITSKLVPLSTGIDMIECSFNTLLNEKVQYQKKYNRGSAIRFLQGRDTIIHKIAGIEDARKMPGVIEVEIYKAVGDKVSAPHESADRLGHVIAVGENSAEASANAERALKKIKII